MPHAAPALRRPVLLLIALALALLACSHSKRTDTIRTATVTVVSLRDGFKEWDLKHQNAIVDAGKEHKLTKDEVKLAVEAYRQQRDPLVESIADVLQALLFASTQNDDPSLTRALGAVKTLVENIANFRHAHEGVP